MQNTKASHSTRLSRQQKGRAFFYFHIIIWLCGTLYLLTGAFSSVLWFDEAYSVGIIRQSVFDIPFITAADVHPPFYYMLLWLYSLVAGGSLVALRIFSVLCASCLALLGLTHIKKDFGELTGFLFTLLCFLFSTFYTYANEIRMYTLGALLVTLMSIYAYRYHRSAYKDKASRILFITFSLLASYTHVYCFITAAVINLYMLLERGKAGKEELRRWTGDLLWQCVGYFFGFYCLIRGFINVAPGFWISVRYPDVIFDTFAFYFVGNVKEDIYWLSELEWGFLKAASTVFWLSAAALFVIVYRKNKANERTRGVLLALKIPASVIGFFLIVSLVRPLYYPRYLTVFYGFFMLFLAYTFKYLLEDARIRRYFVCAFLLICLCASTLVYTFRYVYNDKYDPKNDTLDQFVAENMRTGDIIVSDNIGLIAVFSQKFPEYEGYFYNGAHWGVEKAYEAFLPQLRVVRDLEPLFDTDRRIWVIQNGDNVLNILLDGIDKQPNRSFEAFMLPSHRLYFEFVLIE